MKRRPAIPKWARWIGFAASLLVLVLCLLYPKYFLGSNPKTKDTYLFLGLALIPALAGALICFTRLFWTVTVPGMWFLLIAVIMRLEKSPPAWSPLLVFGALAMLLAPLVAWVSRLIDRSTDSKSAGPSNESTR
jgi:hypothetical protein